MPEAVYDSSVLIGAERNDRRVWRRHRAFQENGVVPVVPTPVLAQVWRGGSRQVRLRFLLKGCGIEPFTEARAEATRILLGEARTPDIVDASAVECARRWTAAILTSDSADIERLLRAATIDPVIDAL